MSNRISVVTTKFGDKGMTKLGDGTTVPKSSAVIAALGDVDELNSCLGNCPDLIATYPEIVSQIQNDLFEVGGALCCPGYAGLKEEHVRRLEEHIARLNEQLPPLREFVKPRGPAHVARTVCRRAERSVCCISDVNPSLVQYLNRLSDLLFVMARKTGSVEQQWVRPCASG